MNESVQKYHLLAFAIVSVWGTTFVSTKVLLNNGLNASEIFFCRFLLAYIFIWIISPKKLFAQSIKDELTMLALGVTGGSLYFLTENMALVSSPASNVSLIVCTTPILTALLLGTIYKSERLHGVQIAGSILAFLGMVLVVLNGKFVLKISPVGDALAFAAAWMWAFYSLFMKQVMNRYSSAFINRKIFFYGLITILPILLMRGINVPTEIFIRPTVIFNLLFLGIAASLLCYYFWGITLEKLGVATASNYIYLNPVVTMLTAYAFINERITIFAILGSVMILVGLYFSNKKTKLHSNQLGTSKS
ncbi:MAG: DMT family transporter [Salinivirgaceae bacterium]|nr:DMT family transporter [Salinivirgaceae bacterium]